MYLRSLLVHASQLCLATVLLSRPFGACGQSEPVASYTELIQSYVQITMNDGTLKFGTLMDIDEAEVVLDIAGLGATRIPKYLIQSLMELDVNMDEVEQGYTYVSNQPSRYFFAPSGIQLEKGDGYFQSNIALNSISYGFTDRFTGGAIISAYAAGVTAKFGGQIRDNLHVSLGGLATMDYYGDLDRPLVLGFVNVTLGDANKNVTLNLGVGSRFEEGSSYGGDFVDSTYVTPSSGDPYYISNIFYTTESTSYQNPFLVNVSARLPLKDNRWFITENHLVVPSFRREESQTLSPPVAGPSYYTGYGYGYGYGFGNGSRSSVGGGISMGIRSYNQRTGWLWDYGLAGVIGDGFGFPIPWFSFTLEF